MDICVLKNHTVDVKGSPVVCADGIQNVLDPILPLQSLLAFVYHRCQVLHVGFGGKRKTFVISLQVDIYKCQTNMRGYIEEVHQFTKKGIEVQLQAQIHCLVTATA